MKQFKIRCSSISKIITNPQSKTALVSKGCETYLREWVKEQLYNRRKEFHSKYTQKGDEMEDDGLDFIAAQLDYGMLIKNEEQFENDFITGTPDALPREDVLDVKNAWEPHTLPLFDVKPDKGYWWQLQGYMDITGRKKAKLVHVLLDTPAHLIEREARFYARNNGYGELEQELYEEFEKRMTYSDIKDSLKIKVFEFDRDDEAIESIHKRVGDCRKYIAELMKGVK